MKKIVQGLCPPDGLVLDPFLGSGTTLAACKQTGRNGIGIELNEEWAELCKERLSKTIRQPNITDFLEENISDPGIPYPTNILDWLENEAKS